MMLKNTKGSSKTDDDRFMNEMVANQERMQTELEKKVETAKEIMKNFIQWMKF